MTARPQTLPRSTLTLPYATSTPAFRNPSSTTDNPQVLIRENLWYNLYIETNKENTMYFRKRESDPETAARYNELQKKQAADRMKAVAARKKAKRA